MTDYQDIVYDKLVELLTELNAKLETGDLAFTGTDLNVAINDATGGALNRNSASGDLRTHLHNVNTDFTDGTKRLDVDSIGLKYKGSDVLLDSGTTHFYPISNTDIPTGEIWEIFISSHSSGAQWWLIINSTTAAQGIHYHPAGWAQKSSNPLWLVNGDYIYMFENVDGATGYTTCVIRKFDVL